jgi:predicted phosphodiesterase
MRIFALSDIHVDYDANAKWVEDLSVFDYQDDVLILAGDLTDKPSLFEWCLRAFAKRFRKVVFVPGNHDLWVAREGREKNSLQKFAEVCAVAEASGVTMQTYRERGVAIHPLLGWYDYSFGEPTEELQAMWMDFRACRWPEGYGANEISLHFDALNTTPPDTRDDMVITCSHFLPRIDVMPWYVSGWNRLLYPILGSERLEAQLRRINPSIHVYGHSHLNRNVKIDGVTYINNAFGYPSETMIASKALLAIHEC